jgi:hypothetical protein
MCAPTTERFRLQTKSLAACLDEAVVGVAEEDGASIELVGVGGLGNVDGIERKGQAAAIFRLAFVLASEMGHLPYDVTTA